MLLRIIANVDLCKSSRFDSLCTAQIKSYNDAYSVNNSPGGDVGDGGCDSGVLLCILF